MKPVLKWFARYIGSLGTVGMGMAHLIASNAPILLIPLAPLILIFIPLDMLYTWGNRER